MHSDVHYRFLRDTINEAGSDILSAHFRESTWSWDAMLRLASSELILPLLYQILPSDVAIEPGAKAALRSARDLNGERNSLMLAEILNVSRLANEIGVEPIALKGGAHMLSKLHKSMSDRYLADIDLLVPESRIGDLTQYLRDRGYSAGAGKVGIDCHHGMPLCRVGMPIVELHHKVGMGRLHRLLPAREIIENSKPVAGLPVCIRVPSDEHTFLHHVLHTELGHSYTSAIIPRLREAYDSKRLLGRLSLDTLLKMCHDFESRHSSKLIALHLLTIEDTLGKGVIDKIPKTKITEIAWQHRRLLRKSRLIRYLNPYFWIRSIAVPRLSRIRDMVTTPDGRGYILRAPFRTSFYRNLFSDFL